MPSANLDLVRSNRKSWRGARVVWGKTAMGAHEHPLADQQIILCVLCREYASEDRDDFDWEQGVPICTHCMVERADDGEAVLNLGFAAAIDRIHREAERDDA